MAIKRLTALSLTDIDNGRLAEAIQQKINMVARDCMDRPAVKKPRKITVEIEFNPITDVDGDLDTIKSRFRIKHAMPATESRDISLGVKQDGSMFYSEHSTDNVNQRTLDAMDEAEE